MKISGLFSIIILLFAQNCVAQTTSPAFSDYPAAAEQAHNHHKVVITGVQSRRYASMLRAAADHAPDFAGQYILASWGCGASCVMAAAINTKDGKVVWLPFTVCCWPMEITEPLDFKLDSLLLIVHGSRNEKGSGTHYYELNTSKQQFTQLPSSSPEMAPPQHPKK